VGETRVEDVWLGRRVGLEHRTHGHQPSLSLQCPEKVLQLQGLVTSEDAARKRLTLRSESDKATAARLRGGENVSGFREKRHGTFRNFATASIS
jgi:hypothetical protein